MHPVTFTYHPGEYIVEEPLGMSASITRVLDRERYSGTSLFRSPTGLGKSDLNGEVTIVQGGICTVEYNFGLSQGDCTGEVFLLLR